MPVSVEQAFVRENSFHAPYTTDRIPGAILTSTFGPHAIETTMSPLDFMADGALNAGKFIGALGRSVGLFESAAKTGEMTDYRVFR